MLDFCNSHRWQRRLAAGEVSRAQPPNAQISRYSNDHAKEYEQYNAIVLHSFEAIYTAPAQISCHNQATH